MCRTPTSNRTLAPITERPPASPPAPRIHASTITTDAGKTTSSSPRTLTPQDPLLPLSRRPATSYERPQTTSSTGPTTSRPGTSRSVSSQCAIDPPAAVFPSSNTDTIPSSNSAIVKYKTSREQMLDTLNLPSKKQRARACQRAAERLKKSPSDGGGAGRAQQECVSVTDQRFDDRAPTLTALTKVGITPTAGVYCLEYVFMAHVLWWCCGGVNAAIVWTIQELWRPRLRDIADRSYESCDVKWIR